MSSHPHASASDFFVDFWHYMNVFIDYWLINWKASIDVDADLFHAFISLCG